VRELWQGIDPGRGNGGGLEWRPAPPVMGEDVTVDSREWAQSIMSDLDLFSRSMCAGDLELALSMNIRVIMRDAGATKDERDNEAWMHAACLSIAEGVPGWEQPATTDSAAMTSVRRLRQAYDALRVELKSAGPEVK
jgi:hypothetical protein